MWKLTEVNTCLLKYFNIYDYLQVYQVSGSKYDNNNYFLTFTAKLSLDWERMHVSIKYPIT